MHIMGCLIGRTGRIEPIALWLREVSYAYFKNQASWGTLRLITEVAPCQNLSFPGQTCQYPCYQGCNDSDPCHSIRCGLDHRERAHNGSER